MADGGQVTAAGSAPGGALRGVVQAPGEGRGGGPRRGCVYLVGAGPGDPDLLTVKALRLLQSAQVVVYDRLVSEAVLACLAPGAMRIYVGKASGHHHATQAEINALLVRLGRSGQQVLRLKGGDPFVFGRGGEEALALRAAGIRFEVVPGVTAATACAAYAGIPLTHRGVASSVRLLSGHCRAGGSFDVDWASLAAETLTVVVYMGLARLDELHAGLVGAGRAGSTPVALIERGTTSAQRVLHSTLDEMASCAVAQRLDSPCLIVVGGVARLAADLAWFDGADAAGESPQCVAAGAGHA